MNAVRRDLREGGKPGSSARALKLGLVGSPSPAARRDLDLLAMQGVSLMKAAGVTFTVKSAEATGQWLWGVSEILYWAYPHEHGEWEQSPDYHDCDEQRRQMRDVFRMSQVAIEQLLGHFGIWLPAQWYDKVTDGALYPGLLREAAKANRILGEKPGTRWKFELRSVCVEWEGHRSDLLKAYKAMNAPAP